MDMMKLFSTIIMVQLFYSFAITTVVYSMEDELQLQSLPYYDADQKMDLNYTVNQVQSNIDSQTKLPLIEFGALLFYSSNIILDLLLNFAFAIPQMIGFIVSGMCALFAFPVSIIATVQAFASGIIILLYFISILQLIISMRSGRGIT